MVVYEHALANRRPQAKKSVRIKTVALPAEHGGWGLLFEPIVLGLLLAPSIAGVYLALSALGFFLARQPLALLAMNRGRASARTALAKRFAVLYLLVGAGSFTAACAFARGSFVLVLFVATPLAIVQLAFDWGGRRRVLSAELAGAMAVSSLAAAIALAGGWQSTAAFALWAIMICRGLPAILYVRACLARLHKRPASRLPMLLAHGLATIAVAILAWAALAPRLPIVAMVVLLLRAAVGFAVAGRGKVAAKQLGFSEIGFGALTVFAVLLGHAFGF